jgi:putative salt-induced outer membrane protein YdiY
MSIIMSPTRLQTVQRNFMPMTHQSLRASLLLLAVMLSQTGHAAKTDVVVLVNGNAVTGEIKQLEFGSLRYGTDSMGTVEIDWEDIVRITSNQALQIELTDGSRYFGSLLAPAERHTVRIKTASEEVSLPNGEIVRITPIETADKFVQRLEGSFSLGLQAQKSSEVTTSNLAADIGYRSRKFLVGLQLTSTVTDQPSEQTKARQSVQANLQRFRPNRWFTDWFGGWERNDELGIDSRTSAGAALGRYLVQTNRNQFSLTGGLQGARSVYIGDDDSTTKAEGRIEIRYLHRNLAPESNFVFTSKIYPLLEDLSQYRVETDFTLRREFVKDLFFDLTIGHSYISDPPTDASSTDYSITTSLGYSF